MYNSWRTFEQLENKNQGTQNAVLNHIFSEGKSLALTFAGSKETFPEARRNFIAALTTHPKFESRLLREFGIPARAFTRFMKSIARRNLQK
jgi:hypothetical protein